MKFAEKNWLKKTTFFHTNFEFYDVNNFHETFISINKLERGQNKWILFLRQFCCSDKSILWFYEIYSPQKERQHKAIDEPSNKIIRMNCWCGNETCRFSVSVGLVFVRYFGIGIGKARVSVMIFLLLFRLQYSYCIYFFLESCCWHFQSFFYGLTANTQKYTFLLQ